MQSTCTISQICTLFHTHIRAHFIDSHMLAQSHGFKINRERNTIGLKMRREMCQQRLTIVNDNIVEQSEDTKMVDLMSQSRIR